MAEALSSVQPEKILKELEKLWIEMGQGEPDKSNPVLRACSMTFLVALDEDDDAQAAGETLAELMHEHPSRAIVLRIDTRPGETLEAVVLAQCWMPFGRRQQICCEQIEIRASASRLEEVPRIVMGVMVPDLPVVLWCRGAGLCRDERFQKLFPMIDKVIVDSAHFADAAGGDRVREIAARAGTDGRSGLDAADALAGDGGVAVRRSASAGVVGKGGARAHPTSGWTNAAGRALPGGLAEADHAFEGGGDV